MNKITIKKKIKKIKKENSQETHKRLFLYFEKFYDYLKVLQIFIEINFFT